MERLFKYLWFWQVYGGWHGPPWHGTSYNIGLEPCSSYPQSLSGAIQYGSQLTFAPGQSIQTSLQVSAIPNLEAFVDRCNRRCDEVSQTIVAVLHRKSLHLDSYGAMTAMKITEVEAIYVRIGEVKVQCDSGQDALIVRVQTDEGISGIGEVDSSPTGSAGSHQRGLFAYPLLWSQTAPDRGRSVSDRIFVAENVSQQYLSRTLRHPVSRDQRR